MAFIPAPNTLMSEMIFTCQGQVCENVFNWEYPTPPDPADGAALAAALVGWWAAAVRPLVKADVILQRIKVTNLTSATGFVIDFATGLPLAGTYAPASTLPNNVTVALKWGTASRGRSFRGRTYFIGMPNDKVSTNAVIPAYIVSLAAAYNQLIGLDTGAEDGIFSVVSRFSNNAPRTTAVVTPITGLSINSEVDSQRRRLAGRGA